MQFTVNQIAELLDGQVDGDGNQIINQFYKIDEGKPNGISFLANLKYENFIYETDSTAVVVNKDFQPKSKIKTTLIKVEDAYIAFTNLLKIYNETIEVHKAEVHKNAEIHPSVSLAKNVSIGAYCCISEQTEISDHVKIGTNVSVGKNVKIGENSIIHSNTTIYDNTIIGKNCVLKSGVVIGSGGFGFAPKPDGTYESIPQIGNVIIKNNVNIGANTCIDCGTMGSTIISEGVKIDNLVQVGHNVFIGENTVIAAQTGIAGSTKIGKQCVIGGQVGFGGHLKVADYTQIGAKSGINRSIEEPKTNVSGVPAFNLKDYLRASVVFRKLPTIEKRISEIENKIKEFRNDER